MTLATVTELRDQFRLSSKDVRTYLEEAGVPADAKGRYDRAKAEDALTARKDAGRSIDRALNGQASALTPAAAKQAEQLAALQETKNKVETERARRLKLQNDKLAGDLVVRADVTATGRSIVVKARTALLGLPDKLGPLVIAAEDATAAAALIRDEILTALDSLADEDAFILGVLQP